MEIEKFTGPTFEATLEAVRQKWGPDAMILHVEKQRVKDKKLLGISREIIEMTVRAPENKSASQSEAGMSPALLEELEALRGEVENFKTSMQQMESIRWARAQVDNKRIQHPLIDFMVRKGLGREMAVELYQDWSMSNPELDIHRCVKDLDQRLGRLSWNDLFPKGKGSCTLFLGLPGSGKTQLLIKIAARMRMTQGADVLMVSADMSRAGPSQELALYSEILQIPVMQIFNLSELESIAKQVSPQTHILVDWKGISPYQTEAWTELQDLKKSYEGAQIILTASMASDLRNWDYFRDQLAELGPVGLALTQADLEYRFGKIWEAASATQLPIAFLSIGKNIPGDFFEGQGFPFARHFFHDYIPMAATKT